eukprot:GHRR01034614.1.p1 GENE.GHRR01034614.1~~GHRR01034614.1.p1  ORF type:complete len:288 (+),score=72.75 GHRR01034614.1:323-1186(+)
MQSRWRIAAFKMIMSYQFEMLIIVAIILNLLIMALTHADMNSHWQNFMSYANLAFTVAFTAEAGAKCVVLGVRAYLRDAWCRFDLFVVAVSIAGVAVDLGTPSNLAFLPLLRVLRVTRIFRLIPKAEGIKNLLQTLVLSLPALGNVGSVLLLFFFIYGVIGMNLFGQMKYGVYLDRHANFSNVGIALLTLFRIITGESWDGIMQDCMVTSDCIQVLQVSNSIVFLAGFRRASRYGPMAVIAGSMVLLSVICCSYCPAEVSALSVVLSRVLSIGCEAAVRAHIQHCGA